MKWPFGTRDARGDLPTAVVTGIGNNDFASTFKRENKDGKLSLMSIITSIVLGVGVAMLGLNYYHASTCIANSPDEKEAFIKAIGHRLESVERSVFHNTAHLDKLLLALQTHLVRLDAPSLQALTLDAQSQAIRIALGQAEFPAPVMPDSVKYKYDALSSEASGGDKSWGDDKWSLGREEEGSAEKHGIGSYASKFDDAYGQFGSKDKQTDDKHLVAEKKEEPTKFDVLTDAEAGALCTDLKERFSVIPGVSWGNLPHDQQQRWLHYSCDYHLQSR